MTKPAESVAAAADLVEDFARLQACWLIGFVDQPVPEFRVEAVNIGLDCRSD